jgi:hypothetical protein
MQGQMLSMGGNIFRSFKKLLWIPMFMTRFIFFDFHPFFSKVYACFVNHENIVIIATSNVKNLGMLLEKDMPNVSLYAF